jgi:hypothetical protein
MHAKNSDEMGLPSTRNPLLKFQALAALGVHGFHFTDYSGHVNINCAVIEAYSYREAHMRAGRQAPRFKPAPLLAGNSSAVYNASGIQYYQHTDWIGTYRFGSTTARAMY